MKLIKINNTYSVLDNLSVSLYKKGFFIINYHTSSQILFHIWNDYMKDVNNLNNIIIFNIMYKYEIVISSNEIKS